ncbi:hypothetical protein MNBD_BACTEROID01-2725 [hydrothermal vent metagenome]|uniref:Urease accessory protein UreH-like transmembrane domain-containing protein n=1 Tax=hydrothermal vent metagenome TaxID=652676 RepID=A0A3B0U6N3_9ZZZZ
MNELLLLSITAASLGFIHTVLGPDHYLPFIVLSKARKWNVSKTMWITFIAGVGHISGSVVLGIGGVALGVGLNKLELIESIRGEIVGWMLITFGVMYSIYGIFKYLKDGGHNHLPGFLIPKKIRQMKHEVEHSMEEEEDNTKLTPWILFIIFVFGPCEVLIPMLIFPAAEKNIAGVISVTVFFGITTILTMMMMVYLGHFGSSLVRLKPYEKYMHLVAGVVILISGIGMLFLGW